MGHGDTSGHQGKNKECDSDSEAEDDVKYGKVAPIQNSFDDLRASLTYFHYLGRKWMKNGEY